jgi:hypothetical protein
MTDEGPRHSQREPTLPEPYESLIRWQFSAQAQSPTQEEARTRLQALLAREVIEAIAGFNATTTRLNKALIALTIVLVLLGVVQLLVLMR